MAQRERERVGAVEVCIVWVSTSNFQFQSQVQLSDGTILFCCRNRLVGIYLQILTRILYKDVSRFAIIFCIFLLTYTGSLLLALRGEPWMKPAEDGATVSTTQSSNPKESTELAITRLTEWVPLLVLHPCLLPLSSLHLTLPLSFFLLLLSLSISPSLLSPLSLSLSLSLSISVHTHLENRYGTNSGLKIINNFVLAMSYVMFFCFLLFWGQFMTKLLWQELKLKLNISNKDKRECFTSVVGCFERLWHSNYNVSFPEMSGGQKLNSWNYSMPVPIHDTTAWKSNSTGRLLKIS